MGKASRLLGVMYWLPLPLGAVAVTMELEGEQFLAGLSGTESVAQHLPDRVHGESYHQCWHHARPQLGPATGPTHLRSDTPQAHERDQGRARDIEKPLRPGPRPRPGGGKDASSVDQIWHPGSQ